MTTRSGLKPWDNFDWNDFVNLLSDAFGVADCYANTDMKYDQQKVYQIHINRGKLGEGEIVLFLNENCTKHVAFYEEDVTIENMKEMCRLVTVY